MDKHKDIVNAANVLYLQQILQNLQTRSINLATAKIIYHERNKFYFVINSYNYIYYCHNVIKPAPTLVRLNVINNRNIDYV